MAVIPGFHTLIRAASGIYAPTLLLEERINESFTELADTF